MIPFLITSFATFLISLYSGSLPYSHYEFNCSTLFNLPVSLYAVIAFLLLTMCMFSLTQLIRRNWLYGLVSGVLFGGGSYHTYARLTDGCVLDYFKWGPLYFNLSDVFITTAIVFLIIFSFIWSEP